MGLSLGLSSDVWKEAVAVTFLHVALACFFGMLFIGLGYVLKFVLPLLADLAGHPHFLEAMFAIGACYSIIKSLRATFG